MPLLLRKIRKDRWTRGGPRCALNRWGYFPDPLGDLATKDGRLSVYEITVDRSNLDRVIAALASANTTTISNLDYALFDAGQLSRHGFELKKTKGGTPDEEVNSEWHRDIQVVTARKLLRLGRLILLHGKRERIPEKAVGKKISVGVSSGQLDASLMDGRLRNKISELEAKT